MGIDFIYNVKRSFKRRWDRGKDELLMADLFSQMPELRSRTILVTPQSGGALTPGDECLLRLLGDRLAAYSRDNQVLGACESPPPDLVAAIHEVGGSALGKVVRVHDLSRKADVEVH